MVKSFKRQFEIIILASVLIIWTGVLGYVFIEGFSFIDAVYMTIITLSTVGFGEVYPLSETGRMFTIVIIVLGFGIFAYSTKSFADFLATGQLFRILRRNKMKKEIDLLDNHFIVCGYGRMGQFISELLYKRHIPFVIIEQDEKPLEQLQASQLTYVEGNAQHDETLIRAGIKKARCLITTLPTDADNIFVVLTAHELAPHLKIATRSNDPHSERKLYHAGADIVVSPHFVGGQQIVTSLLKPTFVDFLDKIISVTDMEIDFDEIKVSKKSPLVGKTIRESRIGQEFNVTILTIKKHDKNYLSKITRDTVLEEGDILLALGNYDQLARLRDIAKHTG